MRRASRAAVLAALAALLSTSGLPGELAAAGAGGTPPPTPVAPRGKASPFPTDLGPPLATFRRPPRISAPSFLLEDLTSSQVLYERRPESERPIASLTKIMTALLVLEDERPQRVVVVKPDAVLSPSEVGYSLLGLKAGERISVGELLYGLLLQSSNDAAVALADSAAGNSDAFVKEMNDKA